MTDQLVKDNERIDDLQNGYYVIQDPDKFCFVKTPEDQKITREFPNTPDSMPDLIRWLNEQHESGRY